MKRIAIIGAGISGLTLAHFLHNQFDVTVFDKSRGVSGRMSTRRSDPFSFDHGANYFTAKSSEFQSFLTPMINAGVVAPWYARFCEISSNGTYHYDQWGDDYPHYVGVPGMNAVGKYLATGLNIMLSTLISRLIYQSGWCLIDQDNTQHGPFDWVVLTTPAPQAIAMLPKEVGFYEALKSVTMSGCFTGMFGCNNTLQLPFDFAYVHDPILNTVTMNHSKPGRSDDVSLVVNTTNQWAERMMEVPASDVLNVIIDRMKSILDIDLSTAKCVMIHRWKYANCETNHQKFSQIDSAYQIAVCADWTSACRVENSFLNAYRLKDALCAALGVSPLRH